MNRIPKVLTTLVLLLGLTAPAMAQKEQYQFTVQKELPITAIQNQANSSTCWAFSGLGFLEMEAIRATGKSVVLSPMHVVSHSYRDKAENYLRYHGYANFGPGGSFYDVLYSVKHYGIVPMSEMTGLQYGTERHNHNELHKVAEAYINAIVKDTDNNGMTTAWKKAFGGIIDSYLGETPESFTYEGKTYTPQSFAKSLGLNMDDYVSLTSFTHHPFYQKFILEIPDNWRNSSSYNLPLDEFMQVFDNAINNGYGIAWGADVSEVGFNRDGLGILVDVKTAETTGSDQARWIGASPSDKRSMIQELVRTPGTPEIKVTQEWRQAGYDGFTTTDDHGMVIYGIAKDQTGKKFYMVKNSWGEAGAYKGIWYVSESFVAGKTMNIVVNKNAIPKAIRTKLGL
ncbi:aminopeptidase C [Porphyromonas levii]|uniref:aminopeptidase C n=1 Tax=Porphyromonas levii TaxID=28114 RepID=UPI001B8B8698|nr:C1 family peptidase [Porphyromonas levii]MBR8770312.1 hypothetical protein [Porphyromonas levii]